MLLGEGIYSTLDSFLPAGTITFDLVSYPPPTFLGRESLAEDGWRTFPDMVVGFRDDSGTLEKVSFLLRHRFIAATYHVSSKHMQLYVRIYIIPWDLPGSRGELRSREESVQKRGRTHLSEIFRRIRTERSLWEGHLEATTYPTYFVSGGPDNRTLLDIYNTLPSPPALATDIWIPGLRTTLYQYQQQTVAAMVARETSCSAIEHPLYLPVEGVNGKIFFVQPATMEIITERPRVSAAPGGILCEELGTGKTVMILSLVMATMDQISKPEEVWYEERTPLTPLAFRKFRTPPVKSIRDKLVGAKKSNLNEDQPFPSLVETLLHKCRVVPEDVGLHTPETQEMLERHRLFKLWRANVPFYLQFHPPSEELTGRRARQQGSSGPRVMYLTTATLIIVPDNLRQQWASEILKHCTDILRVYLVDDKRGLPDAPVLATDFDIVLMSHSRFLRESEKQNIQSLSSWTVCECQPKRDGTLRRCKCSRRHDVSPLLQIRWKRLVVDEGHNTAEVRTEYAHLTKALSVERRWVVTGTPTTNLLGINLGTGLELLYPEEDETAHSTSQRAWPSEQRDDLRKIGNMLGQFLRMLPFAADSKAFSTLVSDPLFKPGGPSSWDVDVLVQVMSSVMVRHRIEDVESEVSLALLHHQTVLLDMHPLAVKTYNRMQAIIAANVVDTERQHQDYLFHPRNAHHLQRLVSNISQSFFWHVIDDSHEERLVNMKEALNNLHKRNGRAEDFELIKQALHHLQSTIDDPLWKALQIVPHIFHQVDEMPVQVYHAWSSLPETARATTPVPLLSPGDLGQLRQSVTEHPLSSVAKIVEMGRSYHAREQAFRDILRLNEQSKKKSAQNRHLLDATKSIRPFSEQVKGVSAKEKIAEMQREMDAALAKFKGREVVHSSSTRSNDPSQHLVKASMLRLSTVAKVRIRNSTSTKLDYILKEVLTYGSEEKFLIFSESPLTLEYVAEALDMCKVKYLSFSGRHSRAERQSMITTFETSDLYRVMLLELRQGARGLNLVSASRVIFCEPVWKADVESQAIKRVHRIGQTRPVVHVTTLAIRSTFEEVIVARSKALRENKQEVAKAATDDRTVRDFIANPKFMAVPTGENPVSLDIPLFDLPPLPTSTSTSTSISTTSISTPSMSISTTHTEPPQKKRRVTFAD